MEKYFYVINATIQTDNHMKLLLDYSRINGIYDITKSVDINIYSIAGKH